MKPGPDGNRDRGRDLTWLEVNKLTKAQRERQHKRADQRRRNRDPRSFGKVNWEAYQHDQLYNMIMSASPDGMEERSRQWRALAGSIERTTGTTQKIMQDLLNVWRGSAAVAAAGSNSRLMQWAGDASHTTTRIAAGMANYTEAVLHAQKTMPDPGFADAERNFRNGYTVGGTGGPSTAILLRALLSDQLVSHEEARERKAEAVRVMNAYEGQSKDTHDRLPEGFEPINPAANPNQPTDDPRPVWIDTPPGHPGPDRTPGPGGGSGVPGDVDGDGIQDGTTPGGYAGSGTGPGFGAGAGAPGSGGGVGAVPGGGGSGGADPIRGGTGLAASAGGALGGPGGTRGPIGGGGFFPPLAGAGAQGDQDREHRIKYDDGMDLFDDLPPAYPPVFGG